MFKSHLKVAQYSCNSKIKNGAWTTVTVRRGDIYYADLSPVVGSEQGGVRPVLIVQNDVGNKFSPTVIAAAITSQTGKTRLPTHISLNAERCGLSKDSVVLLEQIRTLDKKRLKERMGSLDPNAMLRVNQALQVSFGLGSAGDSGGVSFT
jgi:mRNA interferase MazF